MRLFLFLALAAMLWRVPVVAPAPEQPPRAARAPSTWEPGESACGPRGRESDDEGSVLWSRARWAWVATRGSVRSVVHTWGPVGRWQGTSIRAKRGGRA